MQSEANSVKRKRAFFELFFCLFAALGVLLGWFFLGPRRFYFLSVALALLSVLPFWLHMENSRPSARALALAAALAGLAVAGRAAFFMVPQFKPMLAIVILSGVALGPQAGFFVGSLSAFCSNFLFGQGPWTPFQMLAFGLAGFLSGVLYMRGPFKPGRVSLSVFGALCAFFVYGFIMNFYSLVSFMPSFGLAEVVAVYGAGILFDCVHAAATAFFLFLLSGPLLARLARMKQKYGISFE